MRTLRDIVLALARQEPPAAAATELMVTEPLPAGPRPEAVTFSGGVADFLFAREPGDFGDPGPALAHSLSHGLADGLLPAEVWDPGQGIRATAIGASQFTVQVSGNTILVTDPAVLPITNLPFVFCDLGLGEGSVDQDVVAGCTRGAPVRHDLDGKEPMVALALRWAGSPRHARLHALAQGLTQAVPGAAGSGGCLVLLIDGDVGMTLGRLLRDEVAPGGQIISVDGLKLRDLDYVDIGEMIQPTGVVPVIIKTLLFPAGSG